MGLKPMGLFTADVACGTGGSRVVAGLGFGSGKVNWEFYFPPKPGRVVYEVLDS